jgi:hypothetical protein
MSKKKPDTANVMLKHPDRVKDKPICPLTGSRHSEVLNVAANQIINTLRITTPNIEERDRQIQAAMAQVMGVKPQDELEGMLAAQMVACHYAAMECFRRAMLSEQSFEGRAMNLSQANKLTRSYTGLLDALNKHRGKGQQKVTVEHVHVHAGGQAIVGSVEQTGGGSYTKTEEQAHATEPKKLASRTGESDILPPLWREDEKRQALPVPRDA